MFDKANGFLLCKGLPLIEKEETKVIGENLWLIDKRLHKFRNDEILELVDNKLIFFDGYVNNKTEICKKYKTDIWGNAFVELLHDEKTLGSLRGGFCGLIETNSGYTLFVDQIGSRGMYYYCNNGIYVFSSNFYFMIELLKKYNISLSVNEQAVKYMLQQGFMLDESTFAKEIKRVLPGFVINIDVQKCECVPKKYYVLDNKENLNEKMTEQEAIEGIDYYFRQAVKREFEKDVEYNYEHLVDLSGGLDSRMTCWCAHQMGYTKQVNFTYCQSNYLDFKIAQDIAMKLKHTFIYMPLDDLQWYKEIDEILKKNNGVALYSGITGGNRMLSVLNVSKFGIEHTGMAGDIYLSTFYSDEKYNYDKPCGNENAYSNLVKYEIPNEVLEQFEFREQFSAYTRGLLGAQSSYLIRQNYVEPSSPFLDVDFLDFVFSIPFKYRRNHYIYLRWIENKYPEASEFGWEKWYGIKPKLSNLNYKRVVNTYNKYINKLKKIIGAENKGGMNPIGYWLSKDNDMMMWIKDYYDNNVKYAEKVPDIKDDICNLFKEGGTTEKEQVLTVLTMIKYIVEL